MEKPIKMSSAPARGQFVMTQGLSLAPNSQTAQPTGATTLSPIRGHDLNGSKIESQTRGMNCTDLGQLCPPGGEKRARRMAKYREDTTKSLLAFSSSGRTVQLGHHPAKSYPNYQFGSGSLSQKQHKYYERGMSGLKEGVSSLKEGVFGLKEVVSSQGTVLFQTVSFSPCGDS